MKGYIKLTNLDFTELWVKASEIALVETTNAYLKETMGAGARIVLGMNFFVQEDAMVVRDMIDSNKTDVDQFIDNTLKEASREAWEVADKKAADNDDF